MEKLFSKNNKKRWICLLLVLCMVTGISPVNVYADSALALTIEANKNIAYLVEARGGASYRIYANGETQGKGPNYDDLVELYFDSAPGCYIKSLKANGKDLYITSPPSGNSLSNVYSFYSRFYITESTHIVLELAGYHTINFDANTGNGTMEAQVFESGNEKALLRNSFSKTGYIFSGWNTKADGSGTAYTDGQNVKFIQDEPKSTTLYAQWEECTNHNWTNNICDKCGLGHTHMHMYSASGNVITETCKNDCSHNETATVKINPEASVVYDGSAIEALEVSYSDGWQGGLMAISYENNINAGTAQGTITKDGATALTTFEIEQAKPVLEIPAAETLTYGTKLSDVSFSENGWNWGDEDEIPTVHNSGYLAYYTPEDLVNYDWSVIDGWNASLGNVVRTIPVTVLPKEITITWGDTILSYDGTEKFPEFIVSGILQDDVVQFECDGAAVEAGEDYIAKITGITGEDGENYKLPEITETSFSIERKSHDIIIDDEITGGTITVDKTTAKLEESVQVTAVPDNGYEFVGILIENEKGTCVASLDTEKDSFVMPDSNVIVRAVFALKEYTVTVPEKQIGYKLKTDVNKVKHGKNVQISFDLKNGYEKTKDFAVKVNGKPVKLNKDNKAIVVATEDLVITVEGVKQKTVLKATNTSTPPRTDDNSNLLMWITLCIMSGVSVLEIIRKKQKRRV